MDNVRGEFLLTIAKDNFTTEKCFSIKLILLHFYRECLQPESCEVNSHIVTEVCDGGINQSWWFNGDGSIVPACDKSLVIYYQQEDNIWDVLLGEMADEDIKNVSSFRVMHAMIHEIF